MLPVYIVIALFIAWIWVDYFRRIDIFEKNNLLFVVSVFLLGTLSVGFVYLNQWYGLGATGWNLNGKPLNDFAYSVFGIGLVEEIAKMIPFLIFLLVFRKKLTEPIDYLTFVCISALGFSAAENVLYFHMHGSKIIISRSILCSISHMFDSAIVGYAFILYRFRPNYKNPFIIVLGLLVAALAHGIYDFWLITDQFQYAHLITIFFFFITVSIFATILNNALNNSAHFTYKKAIDSDHLYQRMFLYYGIVFLLQFSLISYEQEIRSALTNLLYSFLFSGIIVAISVLRLSRFTLIQGKWNPFTFELPFYLFGGPKTHKDEFRPFGIRIKGATHNEVFLAKMLEEYVYLLPLHAEKSTVTASLAYIEKKIHVGEDEAHYLVKVYHNGKGSNHETILIKPKAGRGSHTQNKLPIVAKMALVETRDPKQPHIVQKKYRFVEWVCVKKVEG